MKISEHGAASQSQAESRLTKLAAWIEGRNIPFLVTSVGLIVMLLWAGA
jgi:hypothetical protein